jgi:hexosaminidase
MYRRLDVINNSLELVGIRHLQVKEFLLRNIANYQNVDALRALTEISEPFKIYSRNAGGTEYKSFSPFTLFADACTADARDVRPFRALVNQYVSSKDDASKKEIITYLTRWSEIGKNLTLIEPNAPLVKRVLPYANRVGKIADLCLTALNNGQMSQEKSLQLAELLNKKEDPKVNLDVELAVTKDLIKLGKFLEKN